MAGFMSVAWMEPSSTALGKTKGNAPGWYGVTNPLGMGRDREASPLRRPAGPGLHRTPARQAPSHTRQAGSSLARATAQPRRLRVTLPSKVLLGPWLLWEAQEVVVCKVGDSFASPAWP